METIWIALGVLIMILVVIAGGSLLVFAKLFHKIEQGKALVVSTRTRVVVTFVGQVVIPVIHKAEVMDISVKTLDIDRRGDEGLVCQDNIRADIKVTFFVRVNKTTEDVIKVAQSIGCARASDQITLNELFTAKFSEALKTVGKQLDFVDLYTKRDEFRDRIISVIGTDLNGYILEDAAIDYLEQTPIESLDPDNILDAQGIRKITELTAIEHVSTNLHQNEERKSITRQNVEAQETIYELERQQADAEARQKREIATVRAREEAETLRVAAEERLKSERARLTTDEQVNVQQENLEREVAVAEKNKERVIAIETERVEKDRQLEVVSRERETDLARIAKDIEVEDGKKDVADIVRERIAVDKTVAEQEEAIKSLRVVEDAERHRQAVVISAEAEAQEALVKELKAAEAAEQAAEHHAHEQVTLSRANLEAADMDASADIRRAEAVRATEAAPGLAEVEVRERDADAVEKLGLAQAHVARESGSAEGAAIQAQISGEAAGLTEKADAMAAMNEATREHEEFRMRIDALKEVQLEEIDARTEIAKSQAELISTGLEQANIDIVGGESVFFDRLVGAIAYGKSVDGFIGSSEAVQTLLGDHLDGEGDLLGEVKSLVAGLGTEGLKNLTVSALLMQLMSSASGDTATGIGQLLERANELGLGDMKLSQIPAPTGASS